MGASSGTPGSGLDTLPAAGWGPEGELGSPVSPILSTFTPLRRWGADGGTLPGMVMGIRWDGMGIGWEHGWDGIGWVGMSRGWGVRMETWMETGWGWDGNRMGIGWERGWGWGGMGTGTREGTGWGCR